MKSLYHRLLLLIAGATHQELAAQVRYLKTENQILRSKLPQRVPVTRREKGRLVRFGLKLGKALNELVSIVHPDTLRRWIREERKGKPTPARLGRKRTVEQIEQLIVQLAKDTGWGYTRILGELRKLGIQSISRNTVKNILRRNGYDPGPKRGLGTWDEFLKIHAATLWQCDFFSKRVLTLKGFRDLYLLVFLHVESRRVLISPSTFHPDEAWVKQQAHAFGRHVEETGLGATIVMHDRDTKFTASFDDILESAGLEAKKIAHRAPNTNAFVERFIQTLQQECLDYFVVFGEEHMDYLCSEFLVHYHEERPHQSKENEPLLKLASRRKKSRGKPPPMSVVNVECRERLGGLLRHYVRRAA